MLRITSYEKVQLNMARTTFDQVSQAYDAAGWSVFPTNASGGYDAGSLPTGYQKVGNYPTPASWSSGRPDCAVMAFPGLIGIDVDHYADKTGADTLAELEAEFGKLPATFSSTSRGEGQPSRIFWFRTPVIDGAADRNVFVTNIGGDIDIIQSHHRFGAVFPTISSKTGETYRWFSPDGTMLPEVSFPRADELAELPARWVQMLQEKRTSIARSVQESPATAELTDGIPCRLVESVLERYPVNCLEVSGNHGAMVKATMALALQAVEGHKGTQQVADDIRKLYVDYASAQGRDGDYEFDAALTSAFTKIPADHAGSDCSTCHDVYELPAEGDELPVIESSWTFANFDLILSEDYEAPTASVGTFGGSDGYFYPGELNTIQAPSGTGKSWIAAAVIAENLLAGNDCLVLDYEMTPATTAHRLKLLGVPNHLISRHLFYANPSDPHTVDPAAWRALLKRSFTVAVIDGVTAAMSVYGGSTNDQDAVSKWFREVPTAIARSTGAAVITVDHTSKEGAKSGFAVGSQHKRAAVGGVSYTVEVDSPLGPGRAGSLRLLVAKDRHGAVQGRSEVGTGLPIAAVINFNSTDDGMQVSLNDSLIKANPINSTREAQILEKVMRSVTALSKSALAAMVTGSKSDVLRTIDELAASGELVLTPVKPGSTRVLVTLPESTCDHSETRPVLFGRTEHEVCNLCGHKFPADEAA